MLATMPEGEGNKRGLQAIPTDKGKVVQEEVVPGRVEPISVVIPSPPRSSIVPASEPQEEKKDNNKSKRTSDKSSTQRWPKHLKETPTSRRWSLPSPF